MVVELVKGDVMETPKKTKEVPVAVELTSPKIGTTLKHLVKSGQSVSHVVVRVPPDQVDAMAQRLFEQEWFRVTGTFSEAITGAMYLSYGDTLAQMDEVISVGWDVSRPGLLRS